MKNTIANYVLGMLKNEGTVGIRPNEGIVITTETSVVNFTEEEVAVIGKFLQAVGAIESPKAKEVSQEDESELEEKLKDLKALTASVKPSDLPPMLRPIYEAAVAVAEALEPSAKSEKSSIPADVQEAFDLCKPGTKKEYFTNSVGEFVTVDGDTMPAKEFVLGMKRANDLITSFSSAFKN